MYTALWIVSVAFDPYIHCGASFTGFIDLQTDKADLMENVGTIPFLDYKHFASRIFFPEVEREL